MKFIEFFKFLETGKYEKEIIFDTNEKFKSLVEEKLKKEKDDNYRKKLRDNIFKFPSIIKRKKKLNFKTQKN